MEIFNNTTKVVRDDLKNKIQSDSRISIAAACFSIEDGIKYCNNYPQNMADFLNKIGQIIPRLILKGMHQTIKHFDSMVDNNYLTAELLQENTATLRKYNLHDIEETGNTWIN